MTAHAVTSDSLARYIGREVGGDNLRQFSLNIVAHPVMLGERRLGGVDIETRAKPEIIGAFGVIGHAFAARAGVGCDKDYPKFSAGRAKFALVRHIGVGAGEA